MKTTKVIYRKYVVKSAGNDKFNTVLANPRTALNKFRKLDPRSERDFPVLNTTEDNARLVAANLNDKRLRQE